MEENGSLHVSFQRGCAGVGEENVPPVDGGGQVLGPGGAAELWGGTGSCGVPAELAPWDTQVATPPRWRKHRCSPPEGRGSGVSLGLTGCG